MKGQAYSSAGSGSSPIPSIPLLEEITSFQKPVIFNGILLVYVPILIKNNQFWILGLKQESVGPKWKLYRQYVSHTSFMDSICS